MKHLLRYVMLLDQHRIIPYSLCPLPTVKNENKSNTFRGFFTANDYDVTESSQCSCTGNWLGVTGIRLPD